jgi:hypothetical protein
MYKGALLSYRSHARGFEGKWMQLEDIMLSEVTRKHKSHVISLVCGRSIER